MKPVFIENSGMTLVGLDFFGDPFRNSAGWTEENEIGRLWKRFMAYWREHPRFFSDAVNDVIFEVHIIHHETERTGEFEVFVGMEVHSLGSVPVELAVKMLPSTTYASFELEGNAIVGDWPRLIYTDWMPASGFESAFPFNLQRYDRRFRGMDRIDESIIDVWVPVRDRTDQP